MEGLSLPLVRSLNSLDSGQAGMTGKLVDLSRSIKFKVAIGYIIYERVVTPACRESEYLNSAQAGMTDKLVDISGKYLSRIHNAFRIKYAFNFLHQLYADF